jgi:predicted GNAT superfamily acetyltransferase
MQNSISIRDVCRADLAEVLEINRAATPAVSRLDATSAESLVALASVVWVALEHERIAGYMIGFLASDGYAGDEFRWFKQRAASFVYVDQIAISPNHRRCGIGRLFYARLAEWSAENDCRAMTCEVNLAPPNPASLAFHSRCGFMKVGKMQTSDGRQVALLEHRLRKKPPQKRGNQLRPASLRST